MATALPATAQKGVSCGSASGGKLLRGVRLPPQGLGYLVPSHWRKRSTNFGSSALVKLLKDTGEAISREHPGAVLVIGDMSDEDGGQLRHHKSHQSGRDVDIGYLRMVSTGVLAPPVNKFISFDGQGRSNEESTYFDLRRNWDVIELLLTNKEIGIEYIFVSQQIRTWLLQYSSVTKKKPTVQAYANKVLRVTPGHNNHFHLRIKCSASDIENGNCGYKKSCER